MHRREVEELQASRKRLVLAADAESRAIERELHDGLLQQLVALAVDLQHATALAEHDAAAAKALLDKMSGDLQDALDEVGRLAERIHAPLFEQTGRLAVALRAAAVTAGVHAAVEVAGSSRYAPEVARTVFLGWLEALDHADTTPPEITVLEEDDVIVFEIVSGATLDRLRDRVEALGGELTTEPSAAGATRGTGRLPLSPND
jgi:signal transduction histidine kinase